MPTERRTHCKAGHEFTPATIILRVVDGRVDRTCRLCHSERFKRWRRKNIDKRRAYQKIWTQANREHIKAYEKKVGRCCPGCGEAILRRSSGCRRCTHLMMSLSNNAGWKEFNPVLLKDVKLQRSYQWLKQSTQKLKQAKQLLNTPKLAA